jgi:hypothetical protein
MFVLLVQELLRELPVEREAVLLAELDSTLAQYSSRISAELSDPTLYQAFLQYVFERRFGWSEHVSASEVPFKKAINDSLDHILSVLLLQPVESTLLSAFVHVVENTALPVSRSQAFQFALIWLRSRLESNHDSAAVEDCFPLVQVCVFYFSSLSFSHVVLISNFSLCAATLCRVCDGCVVCDSKSVCTKTWSVDQFLYIASAPACF